MFARSWKRWVSVGVVGVGLSLVSVLTSPKAPADTSVEVAVAVSTEPKGIEVLTRGPVHEAFATPTVEPLPTPPIARKPPPPLDEMPPEVKPEGEVIWISGYWAFDDERKDFLWVSGTWRTPPPAKQWVAGYWREEKDAWQWVAGFWADLPKEETATQEIVYLPEPPAPPDLAPPGEPPVADSFYVPGYWVWGGDRYVWHAGYWARVRPGYVWVPAHYRWTPAGYLYVSGYWDLHVSKRGMLFTPVYVDRNSVEVGFVYCPAYAVSDTVVLDAMFVRPSHCHYYFGDYYEPCYRDQGFVSCVVYSRSHYEPIIVYERYEHRSDPTWIDIQINLCSSRERHEAPCPPRTLVQQNNIIQQVNQTSINQTNINQTNINQQVNVTNVYNNTVIMPPAQLAQKQGIQTVALDPTTRTQAKQQAQAVQQVALKRTDSEKPVPGGMPKEPRKAPLNVVRAQPVAPANSAPQVTKPAVDKSVPAHPPTPPTPPVQKPADKAAVSPPPSTPVEKPADKAGVAHPVVQPVDKPADKPSTGTVHPAVQPLDKPADKPAATHPPTQPMDNKPMTPSTTSAVKPAMPAQPTPPQTTKPMPTTTSPTQPPVKPMTPTPSMPAPQTQQKPQPPSTQPAPAPSTAKPDPKKDKDKDKDKDKKPVPPNGNGPG
jgi:hypothetical protein